MNHSTSPRFFYYHFSFQGSEEVRAQHILHAVVQLQREGLQRVMEHLESVEGALASYVTKQLSMIHQKLTDLGAPVRRSHLLLHRIDAFALACISTLRESRYQLWRKDQAGGPLAQRDPTLDTPTTSSELSEA